MIEKRVLFIDGEAIILDKPAGLAVTRPKAGGLSLENHLASLTFGFHRWPEAVHRLDRDTSGCLLLARNPKAMKRFQQAFEARTVRKQYLAVLDGRLDDDEGVIDIPLFKYSTVETGWRMIADPRGKASVTRWQRLEERDGRTFVRFLPLTGRTHQVRAHAMLGLGAPIVGDTVYGKGLADRRADPLLLHASRLEVPRAGKPAAAAHAPLPDRFRAAGFDEPVAASGIDPVAESNAAPELGRDANAAAE